MKRKYLLQFDQPDDRDYAVDLDIPPVDQPNVDLRPYMPPVYDQGPLGSCTAQALCGMREYFAMRHGDETDLSRLYLYWHERQLLGTVNEDSGATLRDGMKVLHKLGCCPECLWPYDIRKFKQKPPLVAELTAWLYKIKSYHRVRNLDEMKLCLQHGLPVAIGAKIYESFESEEVADNGIVPVPDTEKEEFLGGHALLVVGYDEDEQYLIVRNSWGEDWGDQGYCYIPYDYYRQGLIVDAWVAIAE